MMAREPFKIGGTRVRAGSAQNIELPITKLITGQDVSLPVRVVHGKKDGPTIWLSSAVHGDEVNGTEVIAQVLQSLDPRELSGTVLGVPVVNVFGFIAGNRYLPDRRDLNRSFPGSPRGSLAARIAHLFMTEVVSQCDVGIDLHTGADRRTNLPQIRGDLSDAETLKLARAFGAPVMLGAKLRDGSLRQAALQQGVISLLYEAGEAGRFDDWAIETGVLGIQRVLNTLGMITVAVAPPAREPISCDKSAWVRARRTGVVSLTTRLGEWVEEGDRLGQLTDTFGEPIRVVRADRTGVVIGLTCAPIVNSGDALVHIASRS